MRRWETLNRLAGAIGALALAAFGLLFGMAGIFVRSEPRGVAFAELALRREPTPENHARLAEAHREYELDEVLLRGSLLALSGLFAYGAFLTFRAREAASGKEA